VRVTGRYTGGELEVRSARAASEGEYDIADLLDGPPRTATGMEADLRELLATVQNPHLRALLDVVFGPSSPTWKQFRDAPAAKRYHQAYRHGLLEHSLTVAQAVSAISATFPGIDRDVAVTGALLHDIGKLEAYTADPLAIDMTDLGKLQGERPVRVRGHLEPHDVKRRRIDQVRFRECHHGPTDAEIQQDLEMLLGLRHPPVV